MGKKNYRLIILMNTEVKILCYRKEKLQTDNSHEHRSKNSQQILARQIQQCIKGIIYTMIKYQVRFSQINKSDSIFKNKLMNQNHANRVKNKNKQKYMITSIDRVKSI